MSKTKAPTVTISDDLEAILICAVRYCIGRATYMPGLVTGWIMSQMRGKLSNKTIAVMRNDIDDARRRDGLGMDCDVKTWEQFDEWLSGQVGNNADSCHVSPRTNRERR